MYFIQTTLLYNNLADHSRFTKILPNFCIESTDELCKRAKYLTTLIDVAGRIKYKRTLFHGLSMTHPDGAIIVIQKNQVEQHLSDFVKLLNLIKLEIIAIVVIDIGEMPSIDLQNNDIPVVNCDCVTGDGLDKVREILFNRVKSQTLKTDPDLKVLFKVSYNFQYISLTRLGGATVARLIPGQKVACSNHVRVKFFYFFLIFEFLKVEETYQITDVGTVVGGYLKSGKINENDSLSLGPIYDQNIDARIDDTPSSTPILIDKATLKRKRKSSESPDTFLEPERKSSFRFVDIKVLSIERNRIRCNAVHKGQLCALCIEPVDATNYESILVDRGSTISTKFSHQNVTGMVTLSVAKNLNFSRRMRISIFYDTAIFDGSILSISEHNSDSILKVQLQKDQFIQIGDTCLVSCMRSMTDVIQAKFVI